MQSQLGAVWRAASGIWREALDGSVPACSNGSKEMGRATADWWASSRGGSSGVMEIDGSGRKVTGALVASADMQPAMPLPFCFFYPGRPGTGSLTAAHSPQGESICAIRAHISLAVKSKQRIILRNINANRAPTHANLASLQRAAEPAVTPLCRRPPEATPLSHVRRPVLLIGRGPVTDLWCLSHSSMAVSECVSGLLSC
jgi:hypothetical protein